MAEFPAIQAAQAGLGSIQSIVGAITAGKAQKQLNKMLQNAPKYQQNQSILDYYNKALARYNASPTDTGLYKRSMQNIGRGLAGGINALQDRRSAIAGLPGLLRAGEDAKLNAEVAAEGQRDQRFGVLGAATGMKANEADKEFQQNQMYPFEAKYNLLAQKAGGANQMANAGMQNVFGALQNWGNMSMLDQMYSNNSKNSGGFYGTKYGKLYR